MRKPHKFWNDIENCRLEALKYLTRSEFNKNSSGAYYACLRNNWDVELFKHMNRIGNRYVKCVYVYEFSDNHAYIGITYDMEKRIHDRNKCKTDSVIIHIGKSKLTPKLIQLTDYISVDEAVLLEDKYVNEYMNNGWKILNKVKTGSIGGVLIWTKEKCLIEALKHKNRTSFLRNSKGASNAAIRNGWLNEMYSHMTPIQKVKGYWTKDNCRIEFMKYITLEELKLNSITAYSVANKNGWINELSAHMVNKRKCNGYWTIENCIIEASKYTTKSDFRINSGSAYNIAHKNGWLSDIYNTIGI